MNGLVTQLKHTLRHLTLRSLLLALAGLLLTAAVATYVGIRLHNIEREVLIQRGELNAKASATECQQYLLTRSNIVTLVGYTVDSLLDEGADGEAIEAYLTDQTSCVIATLDPTTTGLYGYVNGEYLDGAGWVPDGGFEPTERPWYVQAVESGRKVTLVEPYLDVHTNTVMMTVALLLSDGVSVIAMDIVLSPIQALVRQIASATEGSQAFVINEDGVAVVHSDENELGRNYLTESDSLGGAVAHRLLNDGQMLFDLNTADGSYSVYVEELEGGWYSVSLINADIWYRPLRQAMGRFYAELAVVVLLLAFLFLHLTAKNAALQELHARVDQEEQRGNQLKALSETDRMTGLYDRVSGERKINALLAAGRAGMFLELDIDRFKSINDSFGHQTGDLVILAVADALRSTFRTGDVTMRLGGDEFGVFAADITEREMGAAITRRLFARLDALVIPELQGGRIHVSAGAVLCPSGAALSFRELYALTDGAMYESKKAQGNSLTFRENGTEKPEE